MSHVHDDDCGCDTHDRCVVEGHSHFEMEFDVTEVGCAEIYREFRTAVNPRPTPNEWFVADLDTERQNCIPKHATVNTEDDSITISGGGCWNIYYDVGARFYQSVNLRVDLRLVDNGVPIPGTEISTFIISGDNGALNLGSDICYKIPQGQQSSKLQMEIRTSADTSIQTESRGRIKVTRMENGLKCPRHRR